MHAVITSNRILSTQLKLSTENYKFSVKYFMHLVNYQQSICIWLTIVQALFPPKEQSDTLGTWLHLAMQDFTMFKRGYTW